MNSSIKWTVGIVIGAIIGVAVILNIAPGALAAAYQFKVAAREMMNASVHVALMASVFIMLYWVIEHVLDEEISRKLLRLFLFLLAFAGWVKVAEALGAKAFPEAPYLTQLAAGVITEGVLILSLLVVIAGIHKVKQDLFEV